MSLPVWIPGSYLVREFARHLSQLQARAGRGERGRCEQLDKPRWQVDCDAARRRWCCSYRVYAFDTSVRTAFLDADRGFFNGTSLCLRVEGREHEPHALDAGRRCRAGWRGRHGDAATTGARRAPTSPPTTTSWSTTRSSSARSGAAVRAARRAAPIRGRRRAGRASTASGCWPTRSASARRRSRFWHGAAAGQPPFERYVFMLNAVDDGYGGLEHRASTALIAAAARPAARRRGARADATATSTLLGLISHEYFHTWNVKRLRPARASPARLHARELHPAALVLRGLHLVLRRPAAAAQRADRRRRATCSCSPRRSTACWRTPGRQVQSVAQASFDAWVKYYRQRREHAQRDDQLLHQGRAGRRWRST